MADWMEIIIEAATSISPVNRDWLRLQLAYCLWKHINRQTYAIYLTFDAHHALYTTLMLSRWEINFTLRIKAAQLTLGIWTKDGFAFVRWWESCNQIRELFFCMSRKHMQVEKQPQIKKTFSSVLQHMCAPNTHNTTVSF